MSTELYLPHLPEPVISEYGFAASEKVKGLATRDASISMHLNEAAGYHVSSWCVSTAKRTFDLICVTPALILISPLLGLVAMAVRFTSPGPVIFRQQRAGRHRKLFTIYKFRTMVHDSNANGSNLTATGDPRITRIGHFLRRWKLDELPQLLNVLRGDMSLVGPRPKLPQLELTSMPCRPGVTGAATLLFRKEQHILREVDADQIASFYSQYIAPAKVEIDAAYMRSATLLSDLGILWTTAFGSGHHATRENLVMSEVKPTQATIVAENN